MRLCDAAVEVLNETGNHFIGYGDHTLLHMVSERAGRGHAGPRTHDRVLDALSKTPGPLVRGYTRYPVVGKVRIFWHPEAK